MKVYNLTDVPTDALESRQMVNVPIKVGDTVVLPGTSVVVPNKKSLLSELRQQYVSIGALSIDSIPASYPEGGLARLE